MRRSFLSPLYGIVVLAPWMLAGTAQADLKITSGTAESHGQNDTVSTVLGKHSTCKVVHKYFKIPGTGECEMVQVDGKWRVDATARDTGAHVVCVAACADSN